MEISTQTVTENNKRLEINTSRQFTSWLAEQNISFVFSTYQAGKIFFIGLQPNGQLSAFERTLDRCMGLYAEGSSLYISTMYQLWRLENSLQSFEVYQDYDAYYVPQMSYVTGDLDIHDITVGEEGLIFVNTLFSCLGTVSPTHSFIPLWKPPFISKIGAEDRGYLRGLAFFGDFALVGLSKARENKTFSGLLLNERLIKENAQPRCGLMVIDLRSGDIVHSLNIDGVVEELYAIGGFTRNKTTNA